MRYRAAVLVLLFASVAYASSLIGNVEVGQGSTYEGGGPLLADYGGAFVHGNDTATTITKAGTFVAVNADGGATLDGDVRNVSLPSADRLAIQYDGATDRVFLVTAAYSMHRDAGAANLEFAFALGVGSADAGTVIHRTVATTSDSGAAPCVWIVVLSNGDEVELFMANIDGDDDGTIEEAYLGMIGFE